MKIRNHGITIKFECAANLKFLPQIIANQFQSYFAMCSEFEIPHLAAIFEIALIENITQLT